MKTGRDSDSMDSIGQVWEGEGFAAKNWSFFRGKAMDVPGTLDWPLRRLRFDQGRGSRSCRFCQAG